MSLSFLNQKAIRSAAANSESPLSRCRSLILLVSEVHRSEFTFTVGMMWPKFPGTPSHFIKTVSILRVCHTPTALSLSSYVHGREPMIKSTCGTTNPYAGHVASHGHVGHVMVKLPCETWWHVISMLDMSWSNSYWNMRKLMSILNMSLANSHVTHLQGMSWLNCWWISQVTCCGTCSDFSFSSWLPACWQNNSCGTSFDQCPPGPALRKTPQSELASSSRASTLSSSTGRIGHFDTFPHLKLSMPKAKQGHVMTSWANRSVLSPWNHMHVSSSKTTPWQTWHSCMAPR